MSTLRASSRIPGLSIFLSLSAIQIIIKQLELEGPKGIHHRDVRRGTKTLYNGQVSSVHTFLRVAALYLNLILNGNEYSKIHSYCIYPLLKIGRRDEEPTSATITIFQIYTAKKRLATFSSPAI